MRERLLVSGGTVLAFAGFLVGGMAVAWLIDPQVPAPEGPLYKYAAMARLGGILGAVVLLSGLALVVVGVVHWRRHPRPLTRRMIFERRLVDRSIYLAFALAVVALGIAFASWQIAVIGGIAVAFAVTVIILTVRLLRTISPADLDQSLDRIRPTLRWKPRNDAP